MSLRPKPPKEGPEVFQADAKDSRPVWLFRVGGKVFKARWPSNMQNVRCKTLDVPREIIDMASKPRITKAQFVEDPYRLGEGVI